MPTNVVKTPEDEEKWQRAKEVAEKAGQADNYAYIMGAYKKMNPERFKSAAMPIYNSPPFTVAEEVTADSDGNYMSRQNLSDIEEAASKLQNSIDENSEMEDWVEDKLSAVRQMMSDVERFYAHGDKTAAARVAARHETKPVAQAIADALLHAFRYQEGIERGSHISRDGRKVFINFRDESYGKYDDEDEDQEWELTDSYLKALRPILKPWMRDIRRATVDIGDKNTIEIEVTLK